MSLFLIYLGLHPSFQTVVMDEADASSALAGGNQRVFFRVLVDPAELALALLRPRCALFKFFDVGVFAVFVILELFVFGRKFFHPEFDPAELQNIVSFDFVVYLLGALEPSDNKPHFLIHICGSITG